MTIFERAHVVVIDSNVLRRRNTIERLAAEHRVGGPAIGIPEITFFEMTKNPDHWEDTVRRSLREVARFPEAVVLTTAVKPLAVSEQHSSQPTASVLSPRTEQFRQVLRDLAVGTGRDMDMFLANMRARRGEMNHTSHATDSLTTMRRLDQIASPATDMDERASISRDLVLGDRASFRKFAVAALPRRAYQPRLAQLTSASVAEALWTGPSVTALHGLAVGLLALEWVMRGGVQGASPKRAANDVLDWEYGITALWSEGYCCDDRGALERFEDLRIVGQAVWPGFATWFSVPVLVAP